jgi:hypothetical protein
VWVSIKITGEPVVIAQQTLSVQMTDQDDGGLRIASL